MTYIHVPPIPPYIWDVSVHMYDWEYELTNKDVMLARYKLPGLKVYCIPFDFQLWTWGFTVYFPMVFSQISAHFALALTKNMFHPTVGTNTVRTEQKSMLLVTTGAERLFE